MKKKVAVILLNLGGPDSKAAIQPFLFNFFTDKNIIRLPYVLRVILAFIISRKRSKKEAGESYGALENRSPLLENSMRQAHALEETLDKAGLAVSFKTFLCMRYWHPMSGETAQQVQDWKPDQVIVVPLYPQFSTTTTWSSFMQLKKAFQKNRFEKPFSMVCCYPENTGFVTASAAQIFIQYEQALKDGHQKPRILFSAHGLPEKIIQDGDPYQYQCEQTRKAVLGCLEKKFHLEHPDWEACYQSRVGPMKWIGPSLREALEKAAFDQKAVIVFPHAFTQEHVETLVELDMEYRHIAHTLGITGYYRAQTVGTHPDFIEGLATMVLKQLDQVGVAGEHRTRNCPASFSQCCMQKTSAV